MLKICFWGVCADIITEKVVYLTGKLLLNVFNVLNYEVTGIF